MCVCVVSATPITVTPAVTITATTVTVAHPTSLTGYSTTTSNSRTPTHDPYSDLVTVSTMLHLLSEVNSLSVAELYSSIKIKPRIKWKVVQKEVVAYGLQRRENLLVVDNLLTLTRFLNRYTYKELLLTVVLSSVVKLSTGGQS